MPYAWEPKKLPGNFLSCIFDAGCSPALRGANLMAGSPDKKQEEKARKTTWERKLTKTEI
jgi:hypothetical protein